MGLDFYSRANRLYKSDVVPFEEQLAWSISSAKRTGIDSINEENTYLSLAEACLLRTLQQRRPTQRS